MNAVTRDERFEEALGRPARPTHSEERNRGHGEPSRKEPPDSSVLVDSSYILPNSVGMKVDQSSPGPKKWDRLPVFTLEDHALGTYEEGSQKDMQRRR